jgi:hypothetical protein
MEDSRTYLFSGLKTQVLKMGNGRRYSSIHVLNVSPPIILCRSYTHLSPGRLGGLTERHLESILSRLVSNKLAEFEPPNQTRSVIVYWRKPEEWAEALHDWVSINLMSILTRHRSSAGESNRAVQYYFDSVRDTEPRHPLSLYRHSSPAPPPCDQHSNHYFSGSVYRRHFRWSYGYCGSLLCRAHITKVKRCILIICNLLLVFGWTWNEQLNVEEDPFVFHCSQV